MDFREIQTKSERMFEGRMLKLRVDEVRLPDGGISTREVVEHPGGVGILPVTDSGTVLMVRQFRYPLGEELLEIPAGKMDRGEADPLACAVRELKEETGASAERIIPLGKIYVSPGFTDEVLYLFAATGLTMGEPSPDEDEFLAVEEISLERAVEMAAFEMTDAKSVAAILRYKMLCVVDEQSN